MRDPWSCIIRLFAFLCKEKGYLPSVVNERCPLISPLFIFELTLTFQKQRNKYIFWSVPRINEAFWFLKTFSPNKAINICILDQYNPKVIINDPNSIFEISTQSD